MVSTTRCKPISSGLRSPGFGGVLGGECLVTKRFQAQDGWQQMHEFVGSSWQNFTVKVGAWKWPGGHFPCNVASGTPDPFTGAEREAGVVSNLCARSTWERVTCRVSYHNSISNSKCSNYSMLEQLFPNWNIKDVAFTISPAHHQQKRVHLFWSVCWGLAAASQAMVLCTGT